MSADDGLRKILRDNLVPRGIELVPVETGGTSSGVPDAYWMADGPAHGWIECKATSGWSLKFRPHQLGFARRAAARGVPHLIAVRARGAGSAGGKGDALWLLRGSCADALAEGGLRAAPPRDVLGRWCGAPRTWDWDAARRVILEA